MVEFEACAWRIFVQHGKVDKPWEHLRIKAVCNLREAAEFIDSGQVPEPFRGGDKLWSPISMEIHGILLDWLHTRDQRARGYLAREIGGLLGLKSRTE